MAIQTTDIEPIEIDRHFFANNPERAHFIRPFFDSELPDELLDELVPLPPGWRRWTLVKQLTPGVRARAFVCLEGEPARGEHAVARLFALARPGHPSGLGDPSGLVGLHGGRA
jgi:hypothetical protein